MVIETKLVLYIAAGSIDVCFIVGTLTLHALGSFETSMVIFHNIPYTGCPRRNVQYFGRVFLMLNYTDITQNTYIQS